MGLAKDVKKLTGVEEIQNSTTQKIQREIESFAEKKGIEFGAVKDDRVFVYSVQEVDRSPSDPRFAEARVVAFEKAWLNAQKKLAYFIYKRTATKTIKKVFENNSEGAENVNVSNWDVIKSKVAALSNAALNKALEKLGVDPSKYGQLSYEKRKKLLTDSIIKETLTQTSAKLSGTLIVQTFEGESDGVHAVGLITMYSPKLRYMAKAIATGDFPGIKEKVGHSLSYYLPKNPKSYMSTWGARVIFTGDGLPAIISFGQWSHVYRGGNPITRERYRNYALEKARLLADSYICEFLNSAVYAREKSQIGQKIDTEAVLKNDETSQESVNRMVDIRWSNVKRMSRAHISGVHTIRTKFLKLPSGQELAVAVEAWTYKSKKGAEILKKAYKPVHSRKRRINHPTKRNYINQGKDMINVNDF